MLETLDFTIHIGSTPTFSYSDLYLDIAYAAHYIYIIIYMCVRTVFHISCSGGEPSKTVLTLKNCVKNAIAYILASYHSPTSALCLGLQVTIPVRRHILCLPAFYKGGCLDNRAITFGYLLVYLWVHQVLPCLDQSICQKYQAPCLGFSQNGQRYLNGRLFDFLPLDNKVIGCHH